MTNNEAIRVLERIKKHPTLQVYLPDEYEALDLAIKALEERPQGEWKVNNYDEHSCPICGHYALYEEEADGYYEVQSNFCPNCGADMRGNNEK